MRRCENGCKNLSGKIVLIPIIIGLCFVFASALIGSIAQFNVSNAQINYYSDEIMESEYRNARISANYLGFIASFLQITGGLILSVMTATEAFFVEDKYIKLGLLVFSAITAATLFTVYSSTYY